MRNPNGYGSICKLSGNRRKPYIVQKNTGWKDDGNPIRIIVGYYATREEAMIALAEYNKNPYDVNNINLTLKEVFEKWKLLKAPQLAQGNRTNLTSAFKYLRKIENMRYRDIKSFHMQDIIDHSGGYSRQSVVKNLFGHLDRFAMEIDVINRMYSELTKTTQYIPQEEKTPFSSKEIEILWEHQEDFHVGYILIMIYSGWRINEFCSLKIEDIDLEAQTMKGGSKTINGKNRLVPIHSSILHLVKRYYNPNHDRLVVDESGSFYTNDRFRLLFHSTLNKLGFDHTPHEARHTFRSMLDSVGANQKCIDLMMGHKSLGIGERVYTHKTIEELREAIELITRV